MRIFECVCAFMNFRQVPLSAGLWESAYSTVSATVSGCMWHRLAGVIRRYLRAHLSCWQFLGTI